MSKTFRDVLISIIGLIAVVVTVTTFFLLGFEKSAVNYIGISFLILSEIALSVGVLLTGMSNSDKTFFSAGISSSLSFYFIITLVLFLFAEMFRNNLKGFIALEIIALGAIIIISILIILFAGKINTSNAKISSERKLMQLCENRIFDLMVLTENKTYEAELNKVYESLKYGDKIGASSSDEKIVGSIMKLEKQLQTADAVGTDIDGIIDEINSLMKQRNMELLENKRGGF